jgi:starvation-inducible outer membrane lipoprotein
MGSGYINPSIFNSHYLYVSGQIQAQAACTSGEGAPGADWIGGWVTWRGKYLTLIGTRTPTTRPSSPYTFSIPTVLYRLPEITRTHMKHENT